MHIYCFVLKWEVSPEETLKCRVLLRLNTSHSLWSSWFPYYLIGLPTSTDIQLLIHMDLRRLHTMVNRNLVSFQISADEDLI